MKIFLDTNVVLGYMMERDGFDAIMTLISQLSSQWDRFYVSSLSISTIAYVMRKQYTLEERKSRIRSLIKECNVLPVNDAQVMASFENESPDYEDSLQIACAEFGRCDVIITRNLKHFCKYTAIPSLTPAEFLTAATSKQIGPFDGLSGEISA